VFDCLVPHRLAGVLCDRRYVRRAFTSATSVRFDLQQTTTRHSASSVRGDIRLLTTAAAILTTLTRALAEGRLEDKLKLYTVRRLLIIDEIRLPADRSDRRQPRVSDW